MFKIDSNQTIRISRGDYSGKFSVFINNGTDYEPVRYKFHPAFSYKSDIQITVDKDTFKQKAPDNGTYRFEYSYLLDESGRRIGTLGWYLNAEIVDIAEYGITCLDTPVYGNIITVQSYGENAPELYFSVYFPNAIGDNYIFEKLFATDGTVTTKYGKCGRRTRIEEVENLIDIRGDMQIFIDGEDTEFLHPGEYRYQLVLWYYDSKLDKYVKNTVTHQKVFYVTE